jgi:hypothetical protein
VEKSRAESCQPALLLEVLWAPPNAMKPSEKPPPPLAFDACRCHALWRDEDEATLL